MSEQKHTPGPWHVSDLTLHGCRLVYAPDGRMVADAGRIHRRTDDEMDANAHLIAAAPVLLAELEHLVRLIQPYEEDGSHGIRGLATLNGARAAIVAARGEVQP